jgi:hypothetical protein
MKKEIIFILSIICLLQIGCSKDFLETEPSEKVSLEQIAEGAVSNPDIVAGTITGLYALMYLPDTGGIIGNHDDFGQKGVDIWTDMLSGDIAHQSTVFEWYREFSALQTTTDFTADENFQVWRYYYRIIRSANSAIASLGGNDAVPELPENKHFMGQAKAMRAYCYFYLSQLYSDSYNPAAEILPLYVTPTSIAQPKALTSDIFNQIISDFQDAILLLNDFNRQFKNEINIAVAKSLLAYTYAVMGEYDKTKILTQEVINTGEFTIMDEASMTGGFNDINTPGWMWGTDLTTEMDLSLATWWAQMDIYTYGYQSSGNEKAIDSNLFDLIPNNDVRKGQFNEDLLPEEKFYDPDRIFDGQRPVTTDYLYMRISEIYLLNAEASAKESMEVDAKTSLKALVSKRVPDASYIDALSGQALLDEIYLQTRIELWGEGKSYLALKRNKASVTRGPNHLTFVGEVMSYDDDRLSFEIPQSEIQNNTFINAQN